MFLSTVGNAVTCIGMTLKQIWTEAISGYVWQIPIGIVIETPDLTFLTDTRMSLEASLARMNMLSIIYLTFFFFP